MCLYFKGKVSDEITDQDMKKLEQFEFKYDVLLDKHYRKGRVWFLVHWRDTYVLNGKIIPNHYADVPKLVIPKTLKDDSTGLDVEIEGEVYRPQEEEKLKPSKGDQVHRFIWPPCWLPRTQICDTTQRARMFKLAYVPYVPTLIK